MAAVWEAVSKNLLATVLFENLILFKFPDVSRKCMVGLDWVAVCKISNLPVVGPLVPIATVLVKFVGDNTPTEFVQTLSDERLTEFVEIGSKWRRYY